MEIVESRAGVPSLRPRQSDQRAHRVDWWSARAIVVLCVCVVVRTPTSSLMKGEVGLRPTARSKDGMKSKVVISECKVLK